MLYDVFISYASEDKSAIAKPLADRLSALGYRVFLDVYSIKLGESITEKIGNGINSSRYYIIIFSPHFLKKGWPRVEFESALTIQITGKSKKILPLLHDLNHNEYIKFAPLLQDIKYENTKIGIKAIVEQICDVLGAPANTNTTDLEPKEITPNMSTTKESDLASKPLTRTSKYLRKKKEIEFTTAAIGLLTAIIVLVTVFASDIFPVFGRRDLLDESLPTQTSMIMGVTTLELALEPTLEPSQTATSTPTLALTPVTLSPAPTLTHPTNITIDGQWYSTSLAELKLEGMVLTGADIEPLKYMTNLKSLDLSGNRLEDISVLSNLTNLTKLDLSYCSTTDISALTSLSNLSQLYLEYNNISDISALSGLINLKELNLSGNLRITDITALGGLTKLTKLDLRYIPISDWSPVNHVEEVEGRPALASKLTPTVALKPTHTATLKPTSTPTPTLTPTPAPTSTPKPVPALVSYPCYFANSLEQLASLNLKDNSISIIDTKPIFFKLFHGGDYIVYQRKNKAQYKANGRIIHSNICLLSLSSNKIIKTNIKEVLAYANEAHFYYFKGTVGGNFRLYRYNYETKKSELICRAFPRILGPYSILESSGFLYVSHEGQLFIIDLQTSGYPYETIDINVAVGSEDANGNILVNSSDEIMIYSPLTGAFSTVFKHYDIVEIVYSCFDSIFYRTSYGFWLYERASKKNVQLTPLSGDMEVSFCGSSNDYLYFSIYPALTFQYEDGPEDLFLLQTKLDGTKAKRIEIN